MRCILCALILLIVLLGSCKKSSTNHCQNVLQYTDSFAIKEIVGDTAFYADTIFRDNYVQFESLLQYDSVRWKIGNDPRKFSDPQFSLSFVNNLLTIPITFTGYKQPNTSCFPGDNGMYMGEKQLTTVEQVDKSTLTLSPLIGRYQGAFTDAPADTFTVRIEYFDSAKYDVTMTGNKNFYWISNIPKGFVATSSPSLEYPELSNGQGIEMGYKSFVFGSSSACVQGRGWLSKDSLFINYGNAVCGRKKFVAKKIP